MTKDSAFPKRESLPDGKNADVADYVKDSANGKRPLYGDITPENPYAESGPEHPGARLRSCGAHRHTPAPNDLSDPASRRERDLEMLARANSKIQRTRPGSRSTTTRRVATAEADRPRRGRPPVPQLHPTNDPDAPWMLANDTPDAERESYIDSDGRGVRGKGTLRSPRTTWRCSTRPRRPARRRSTPTNNHTGTAGGQRRLRGRQEPREQEGVRRGRCKAQPTARQDDTVAVRSTVSRSPSSTQCPSTSATTRASTTGPQVTTGSTRSGPSLIATHPSSSLLKPRDPW